MDGLIAQIAANATILGTLALNSFRTRMGGLRRSRMKISQLSTRYDNRILKTTLDRIRHNTAGHGPVVDSIDGRKRLQFEIVALYYSSGGRGFSPDVQACTQEGFSP